MSDSPTLEQGISIETQTTKKEKLPGYFGQYKFEIIQLIVQLVFGVAPVLAMTGIFGVWEQNTVNLANSSGKTKYYALYWPVHIFTRCAIGGSAGLNWLWMLRNHYAQYHDRRRWWRKLNRIFGMVATGLAALNDRQLDAVFFEDKSTIIYAGKGTGFYRNLIIVCMCFYCFALVS
ncbi:hypothetical protein GGF37_001779, partial [Kickxella alabastrina]